MRRLIASLIYRIDRLLPHPRVGGRESRRAYAEWEYEVGKDLLDEHAGHFGPLIGKSILDIGCGLGGKTAAYAEAGALVVGVDIDHEYISQSVTFARSRGIEASFIVGDAELLSFRQETFDLIIANDSLEHFLHPEKALSEFSRVLRPGGLLFLFFTPWRSPLGSHLYDYIRTPWCHLIFRESLIEELLRIVLQERDERQPEQEAGRLMEEFRTELNRITISRYRRILEERPELVIMYEELKPPKFTMLKPLTGIPLLNEFFTGTVVGILRKR